MSQEKQGRQWRYKSPRPTTNLWEKEWREVVGVRPKAVAEEKGIQERGSRQREVQSSMVWKMV